MYQDVSHYHCTQSLTRFRKHSLFLSEDESSLLSKLHDCLCAVIMENVLVRTSDVSHVKPVSKDDTLKEKVNLILEQTSKAQRGSRGVALLFL